MLMTYKKFILILVIVFIVVISLLSWAGYQAMMNL
jgi:hypothetical protein